MIKGLSQNEPIVKNEQGGMQSKLDYDFTLIDAKAMFRLAEVLAYGAKKYERDNWRKVSAIEHLNHALTHAFAYLAGDKQDDHIGHFLCRAMMFCAKELEDD